MAEGGREGGKGKQKARLVKCPIFPSPKQQTRGKAERQSRNGDGHLSHASSLLPSETDVEERQTALASSEMQHVLSVIVLSVRIKVLEMQHYRISQNQARATASHTNRLAEPLPVSLHRWQSKA